MPTLSEIAVAFVGSLLFWVTTAGVVIRTLKIDFLSLEAFLRKSFDAADTFTFSARQVSRIFIDAMLHTLYGNRIGQIVYSDIFRMLYGEYLYRNSFI